MKVYGLLLLTVLLQCTSALEAEITQIVRVTNTSFTCLFKIHYEGDTCFGDSTVSCSPNGKRKVARNVELVLEDGTMINIKKLKIRRMRDQMIGCTATSKTNLTTTESTTGLTNRSFRCTFDDNKHLGRNARSPVTKDSVYTWAGGKIPYYFKSSVTSNDRNLIRRVMKQIHDKTCFRFEETNKEPSGHHVEINTDQFGSCTLGRFQAGVYKISSTKLLFEFYFQLADNSSCTHIFIEGSVLHELMHIFGLEHTQKRDDRDKYITVYDNNIIDTSQDQYDICHDCWRNTTYDCSSIMHYGTKSEAINEEVDTMKAKDPSTCKLTPQGSFVASTTDWELLNIIANEVCSGEVPTPDVNTMKLTTPWVISGNECIYKDKGFNCHIWKDRYCKFPSFMKDCAKTCKC